MSTIRKFDNFHIAFVEKTKADVMLIIDDKLEKMTEQLGKMSNIFNVWKNER